MVLISKSINHIPATALLTTLRGSHSTITEEGYQFDYHEFTDRLASYTQHTIKQYEAFKETKKQIIDKQKKALKLNEFQPKVLSSFVRNKLIDQIYLPLFGDNLAKQLGTVGDNKRTDRMGMLLLISPPGYGKTTLMEYISERLGLVFMKINGPAIGHEVTSVDPMAAKQLGYQTGIRKAEFSV